jgi:hypothetical protein
MRLDPLREIAQRRQRLPGPVVELDARGNIRVPNAGARWSVPNDAERVFYYLVTVK